MNRPVQYSPAMQRLRELDAMRALVRTPVNTQWQLISCFLTGFLVVLAVALLLLA